MLFIILTSSRRLAASALLFLVSVVWLPGQEELPQLRQRFCDYLLREQAPARPEQSSRTPATRLHRGLGLAREQQPDGSWSDIHYEDQSRSNWGPYNHVTRLLSLAYALRDPQLANAADRALLLSAASKAGAFWRAHHYLCPNWWYNEIGAPMSFGEYALLMGQDLPKEDCDYITGTMLARCEVRMTGQNKVWLSGNLLMRGLLLNDEAIVTRASAAIWSEVGLAEGGEGVQADWSFHQHGPQQQFGNYGLGFAEQVSRWLVILRGSRHALPEAKLQVFRNFLLEGMAWVCWRGEMDISACGRQLTPHSPQSKVHTLLPVYNNMETADPSHAADYAAFVRRNEWPIAESAPLAKVLPGSAEEPSRTPAAELSGSRFFWRSDYGVHRLPELFASLKMHSARVIGGEVVNSENLAGRYLADGALLVEAHPGAYSDVFPCWDWHHIPGVTQAWESGLPSTGKAEDRQHTTLVGGLADEAGLLALMDYDRDGVQAHKAWFMHGQRIVALGSGIHASVTKPVHTTINQCLLSGTPKAGGRLGPGQTRRDAELLLGAGSYVEHNGLRYDILEGEARMQQLPRTGNWSVVYRNPGTPKEHQTRQLLTLWFDHGVAPKSASYAYAISQVSTSESQPVILANTPQLQALRWSADLVMLAFWAEGEAALDEHTTLRAAQACLVCAQHTAAGWHLRVCDPSQLRSQLELRLSGKPFHLAPPQGVLAGSSVLVSP